jgi:hypothetical protein
LKDIIRKKVHTPQRFIDKADKLPTKQSSHKPNLPGSRALLSPPSKTSRSAIRLFVYKLLAEGDVLVGSFPSEEFS